MWYVYFLKSKIKENWVYVGYTGKLERRIFEHQSGTARSSKPFLPVYLKAFLAVDKRSKAVELEKYFKTGSGKAILKKRILTDVA